MKQTRTMVMVAAACTALGVAVQSDAGRRKAAPAWEAPAFEAKPKALLAAADRLEVESRHDAVILLEEARYRFDDDGRATYRFRRILRVLRPEGIDGWGKISAGWWPWYQDQPKLRARVIEPNGTVHQLDPDTIEVGQPSSGSEHTYTDRRSVRAPFPAVSVGAIIELELTVRDREPFFAEGDNYSFFFGASVPIQTARLVVDAPAASSFTSVTHLVPKLKRSERKLSGKRILRTFEARDLPPDPDVEPALPGDLARYPHVAFATGRSWGAVATAYERIVEDRIREGDLGEIAGLPAKGGDREKTVAAVLALLHDNVRYSGLEFGRASIVPWTPQETWRRKYGDCKDQATLLVAMLRRVDIEAHVVLLNSGFDRDAEPKLPGMGRFDHAIVRVDGKRPIWIDPTSEFARAGELPAADQGRWALVASKQSRKLVRTPVAPSSKSAFVETREVKLAERGPARVVETTTLSGWYEHKYRYDYRDADQKKLRENIESYAKSEYMASKLADFSYSDVGAIDAPFEIRIAVDDAERAYSGSEEAYVWIFPGDLTKELPDALIDEKGEKEPRKRDLMVWPFVREIRYRIAVPPGFAPRALPEEQTVQLGAAVLTTRFRHEGDEVVAVMRLDSGKPRQTPAEVMAARQAIRELTKAGGVKIALEQVGAAHLEAGRVTDAVREFRRLVRLHPKESLHHMQLAEALLAAGLGKQARAEARRAVALDRKSVDAHGMLGWILQHDLLGRLNRPGNDPAAAEKVYRAAIRVDPKAAWIRGNLAIMLEHDAAGTQYAGKLDRAIAEYQQLRKHTDSDEYDVNLLKALLYAGRYDELVATARDMKESTVKSALRVAAAMASGGAKARDAELAALGAVASDRRTILRSAGDFLAGVRHYGGAADLLEQSAGSGDPQLRQRVATLRTIERVDAWPHRDDAGRPVIDLLAHMLSAGGVTSKEMTSLFARSAIDASGDVDRFSSPDLIDTRRSMKQAGISSAVLMDILFSLSKLDIESAGAAVWRVRWSGGSAVGNLNQLFYVVREGGAYKIVGAEGALSVLGLEAMALVERRKLAAARQVLDWAREVYVGGLDQDLLYGSAFATVWQKGSTADASRTKLAASMLAAMGSPDRASIATLRACPRDDDQVAGACDQALFWSYMHGRQWARALAAIEALQKRAPDNRSIGNARAHLLVSAGRAADADRLAAGWIAADEKDAEAWRIRAEAELADRDFEGALAAFRKVLDSGAAGPGDYNQYAWTALFVDRQGEDAVLEAARQAVTASQRKAPAALNTLAAVHAARGEYELAHAVMIESLEAGWVAEMGPQDWLVYGRIEAGYGYTKDAADAYAKVKPDRGNPTLTISSFELAKKWRGELSSAGPRKRGKRR